MRHPLLLHYDVTGDAAPRTVSDVVSAERWRGSPVYEAARDELRGATYQLGIPLPGRPGQLRNVTIGRPGADFGRRHRALADLVQPLLVSVDGQQRTLSSWRRTVPPHAPGRVADLRLTARETTVLALLATGMTATAIGRRLSITANTVTKHQQSIYRKFGTRDRLTTVLLARDLDILPDAGRRPS
jgi:DNA-binding CsgD family transcriptional regulator